MQCNIQIYCSIHLIGVREQMKFIERYQ